MATSDTGIYFDTKAQKVVHSPPEEGIQIVGPGAEITDAVQAEVKRWTDVENGTTAEVGTVTTAAMGGPTETAAASQPVKAAAAKKK